MSFAYLVALLVAILGMGLLDYRHRLALFGGAPWRTLLIVLMAVGFFLVWDVVGISEGIFFRGSGPWMTGVVLAPELPLEEFFFLALLSYSTLIVYLLAHKYLPKRAQS